MIDTFENLLEFPFSALSAVLFLLMTVVISRFAGGYRFVRLLSTPRMALGLLALGAVLLAVEGTWSIAVHRSPAFVVYTLVLLLSLLLTVLNGFKRRAKWGFVLNHLGIFLILWASLFGAPDTTRLKIFVGRDIPVNMAYREDGLLEALPFHIMLEDFRIDYYEDGRSPRQFTSQLQVGDERLETSVNHPCSYGGYTIYQNSYDTDGGQYTVLLLVRAPWLPVVYLGMLLLALGALMMLFGKWKAKVTIPITLLLTALFTLFSIAKINFGTLMPALRSWWFVPHLFIYMVAYSLMALAVVMWFVERWRRGTRWQGVSDNLVRSSSGLLIIGMLTGSVWAHQAWGDYWAWDPKENWAAVTWFVSLMYLHLRERGGCRALMLLLLAFLALQITWYGVNYLPSAQASMHTYNSEK